MHDTPDAYPLDAPQVLAQRRPFQGSSATPEPQCVDVTAQTSCGEIVAMDITTEALGLGATALIQYPLLRRSTGPPQKLRPGPFQSPAVHRW